MKPITVVGAAGVGRRCADIVQNLGLDLLGVLDDGISEVDLKRLEERQIKFLGTSSEFFERYRNPSIVLGIGIPESRSRVLERLSAFGVRDFPTIIDRNAHCGSNVTLGKGVVVCSGVQISTHTMIGDFVQINPGAIIGHDVHLEKNVSINPGAIISGEVTVGESAMIGAGAVVLQGLRIGSGAIVGAGSVVTRDVEAGAVVKGSPAK